jgi:hypothetical protein
VRCANEERCLGHTPLRKAAQKALYRQHSACWPSLWVQSKLEAKLAIIHVTPSLEPSISPPQLEPSMDYPPSPLHSCLFYFTVLPWSARHTNWPHCFISYLIRRIGISMYPRNWQCFSFIQEVQGESNQTVISFRLPLILGLSP